jgi:hypothetical protein
VKALIWIFVLGVLCVPALVLGTSNVGTTVVTLHQNPHLAVRWDNHPGYVNDLPAEPGFHVTGYIKQLVSKYQISCGSAFSSHYPTYALTSRGKVITPVDVMIQGTANNGRQAESQAVSAVSPNRFGVGGSAGAPTLAEQMKGQEQYCGSQLTTRRWVTFVVSPAGWGVILLLIVAVCGGFAGGGGMIHGSATPTIGGNSWNFRFWK